MARVNVVHMEDWAGLYLDGQLEYEGHSIPDFWYLSLLDKLGIETKEEWQETLDVSHLPTRYSDIKTEPGYVDAG